MAGRTVQYDATAYQEGEGPKKIKTSMPGMTAMTGPIGFHEMPTAEEIMEEVNKATAIAQQHGNVVRQTAAAPGNVSYAADTGRSTSQFNIIGGTIGQAAIGNTGPVVFNQKSKVFQKGSTNTNYKISGGDFTQATIGGSSTYHNDKTTIGAGGGGAAKAQISPEDLALYILERGVTIEQFTKLLEMQYSLVNIACALPREERLKNRMIDALLMDHDAMET